MRPSLNELRKCVKCGEQFLLTLNHEGLSTECGNCAVETVELLGAEIRWEGKQTPVIDITTLSKARRFNNKTKRLGASVTRALVPMNNPRTGQQDTIKKEEHANNPGSGYYSSLGEKHSTKR